jgi:isoprenylcysteine carboxyl methyltransferase (ICMT) family protein YpbQ
MEDHRHPSDYEMGRPPRRQDRENNLGALIKKPVVLIPLLLTIVFLIILLLVNSSKRNELREVREQAAQEREQIVTQANQSITETNTYFLKTLMMPFSWAVRTALLAGNVEQVDQYLYQFVREQNFELILVADASGKIISTTNQKYKGETFASHFDQALLAADSTLVSTGNQRSITVASPVMGLNSRLGTIYAVYVPEEPLAVVQKE